MRSEIIATYALCGFANLSSIGIQLGGLGSMAPNRLGDLAQLAVTALLGGICTNLMTACVAGIEIDFAAFQLHINKKLTFIKEEYFNILIQISVCSLQYSSNYLQIHFIMLSAFSVKGLKRGIGCKGYFWY